MPLTPKNPHALGTYEGLRASGIEGLGRIVTKLPNYDKCAVKRAFEFIVRRPMVQAEIETLLGPLVQEFTKNNKQLWPIIKKIILSPEFIGTRSNN